MLSFPFIFFWEYTRMLNLHVKIAKFGWGGMPPDPATTVWFVTFFNPYEFAGMYEKKNNVDID